MPKILSTSVFLVFSTLLIQPVQAALPAAVDGQALPTLAPVIEKVMPAIVNVHTRTRVQVRSSPFFDDPFFRQFFEFRSVPRERVQQSLGSGVIVDAERGYVLTNNHVIENADDIAVRLADGREHAAELVGADADTDLAVIRIEADNLSDLPLDESDRLRVGDFVLAVGNPFGLDQTVTSGIVSALGRGGLRGLEYQNFIQTDASINPGNSGGALLNLRGELVGINTAIFTPSGGNVGIGFAIPASTAAHVLDQLIKHGEVRRGSFGVEVQDLDSELRAALSVDAEKGAVVTTLTADSVLAKAGLKAGDVIVSVNGNRVDNARGLRSIEGMLPVDSSVKVEYVRGKKSQSARVTLVEDLDARISGHRLDERLAGAQLISLGDHARLSGVLVESVQRKSAAARAGLAAGDVIVAANAQRIEDLAGLRALFPLGENTLVIDIRRRGQVYRIRL